MKKDDLTDSGVVEDKYFSGITASVCSILAFFTLLVFLLAKFL